MIFRTSCRIGWLVLGVWLLSAVAMGQNPSDEVVAEVNGSKITRADVEKEQASKLLQVRYQVFVAEQKALEDLIDDRVLEMEAARQHITVAQLVDREITSKVKDPSDDQLELYYEDSNSSEPFETVKPKILDLIRQRRTGKIRAAYLQQLRSQANVLITLAPPVADFALGDAPRLGSAKATVKLVEFADYECPYCAKVHPFVMKLHEEFGDQVAIYFKDLPLPMHKQARKAAEAARCAGAQGKFWEYHDALFSSNLLDVPQLKKDARQLNLDGPRFDKCLDSGEEAAAVQKDFEQGQQLGLAGTPSFFVEGHYFSGGVDYATLRDMVVQQLNAKKATTQLSQN
jgi:protein-disulfide isomerase